jgi:hypothetical protein
MFDAQGQRDCVPEDVRRESHASLAGYSVYGSQIVSLPSDFLCFDCVSEFRQAPEQEVEADVSSWRQKLHMRSDQGLQHVLAEKVTLRFRDEHLELARSYNRLGRTCRSLAMSHLSRNVDQIFGIVGSLTHLTNCTFTHLSCDYDWVIAFLEPYVG